jgi:hypothetical protein
MKTTAYRSHALNLDQSLCFPSSLQSPPCEGAGTVLTLPSPALLEVDETVMGSTMCCVSSLATPKAVPGVHPCFASIRYPTLSDDTGSGVEGLDVVGVSCGVK